MKSLLPLGLVSIFLSTEAWANQDYIGAKKAISEIVAEQSSEKKKKPNTAQTLRADFRNYQSELPGLSAEQAADQWLDLVSRFIALGSQRYQSEEDSRDAIEFQKLAAALPPPESWTYLERRLDTQKPEKLSDKLSQASLKWFVHTLLGNLAAQKKDYETIKALLDSLPKEQKMYVGSIGNFLIEQMLPYSDDPAFILTSMNELLQQKLISVEQYKSQMGGRYIPSFDLPDLVKILGPQEAEVFIQKVLTTYPGPILIARGEQTRALAARLATINIASLAAAQWYLSATFEGGELYAALAKRFPKTSEDSSFAEAQNFELYRLILSGQLEKALALQAEIPSDQRRISSDLIEHAEKTGQLDLLVKFLDTALRQDPSLPYWDEYFEAANADRQPNKAIALMTEALKRPGLDAQTQTSLRQDLTQSLLSVGQIEEAVADILKTAKTKVQDDADRDRKFRSALEIVELGRLLNRSEWITEGLDLARRNLEAQKTEDTTRASDYLDSSLSLADALIKLKRGPEAESVLIDALRTNRQSLTENSSSYISVSTINRALATLAGIYDEAGRPADVLTLLHQAPFWYATDLSQVETISIYHSNRVRDYLGDCAARALEATGDREGALLVVESMLSKKPGDDRAYETLLRLKGSAALPLLDQLAQANRFEDRPLIWKAQLLLNEGKITEAEEAARAAIAIDPSDGEQGPGDRMRVYAIMAEIKAAQGNTKEAEFFRDVVKSIRMSEDADVLYSAGLKGQAIDLYEKSLTFFADAYCIQSRLALRMNELGRWKEAEEHYQRAYELMPDSFGRVESHCFGCEGAFTGTKQQSVADRVFTALAQKKPDSPQVHYLLGYLRKEQDRSEEAMAEFQKAVTLDPDYLNAWKKMSSLDNELLLPSKERNAIVLNLLRLDPSDPPKLEGVTNLAEIWSALAAAAKASSPEPGTLYPMRAAAEALAALKNDPAKKHLYRRVESDISRDEDQSNSPGAQISKQGFVAVTGQLLQVADAIQRR